MSVAMPLPAPVRPALGDRQIARMQYRIALFTRRGMSPAAAERWADVLAERDSSRDDRRICFECKGLQPSRDATRYDHTCFPVQQANKAAADSGKRLPYARFYVPITDILQRCPHFEFQTP